MNQRIRRLTVALVALFAILFVQLTTWQVVKQDELKKKPGNMHALYSQFDKPRGTIVTADGQVIASSTKLPADSTSRFDYQRTYPFGDLFANITGYYSWGYGRTQLERTQNDVLAGKTAQQQLEATGDLFTSGDVTGSVHVTIDSRIQAAAKKALGNKEGSVVVTNPTTGAVLAMYSNPAFDPNLLVSHDSNVVSETATALQNDQRKPLLANAYQERYMPGSTMKVVTTAIGFDTGFLTLERIFKNERSWTPPNTKKPIRNYGKKVCGGDMAEVFRRSCNIPFAQVAVEIGPDLMVNGTNRFGFDERVPFDLPGSAASTFGGLAKDFSDSLALLAIHGFGQGEVQVTPLHMALIAGSVGNGGRMMQPFVVQETRTNSGAAIKTTSPQPWKTTMAPTTAAALTEMMKGVATNGTASCCIALRNGVSVAVKTGTAQLNPEGQKQRSHAWIMGFAPAEAPKLAISVFIKGVNDAVSASTGGRLAGPIAKQVLDASLPLMP